MPTQLRSARRLDHDWTAFMVWDLAGADARLAAVTVRACHCQNPDDCQYPPADRAPVTRSMPVQVWRSLSVTAERQRIARAAATTVGHDPAGSGSRLSRTLAPLAAEPRVRRGRPPRDELTALRQLAAVEAGFDSGESLEKIARGEHVGRSALRDVVAWGRRAGMFTNPGPGRRGGVLTAQGRARLAALEAAQS